MTDTRLPTMPEALWYNVGGTATTMKDGRRRIQDEGAGGNAVYTNSMRQVLPKGGMANILDHENRKIQTQAQRGAFAK
jgi:hypothetical protein